MKKVLFIGNSHTYYNDMVAMFMCMCNQCETAPSVEVTMLAHPYVKLEYHKDQPEIRFNILYGGYDYVVIQQAAHPFEGEEVLIEGARAINEFIKEAGATPVAYMTWSQKSEPHNQELMTKSYIAMAKDINAILAPVGIVFETIRKNHPEIELFHTDGCHASKIGSYIVAATLFSSIFKIDPIEIDSKLEYKNKVICDLDSFTSNIIKNEIIQTLKLS